MSVEWVMVRSRDFDELARAVRMYAAWDPSTLPTAARALINNAERADA